MGEDLGGRGSERGIWVEERMEKVESERIELEEVEIEGERMVEDVAKSLFFRSLTEREASCEKTAQDHAQTPDVVLLGEVGRVGDDLRREIVKRTSELFAERVSLVPSESGLGKVDQLDPRSSLRLL